MDIKVGGKVQHKYIAMQGTVLEVTFDGGIRVRWDVSQQPGHTAMPDSYISPQDVSTYISQA